MRTYNLVEAAALLGVSLVTLRRWRVAAAADSGSDGVGSRGSADLRRVWLTRADVVALARAHGRVLVESAAPGDGGNDVATLLRDVADLRARVVALERLLVLAVGTLPDTHL
jgi:hypothetical protein